MPAVENAGAGAAGLGRQHLAIAGHAQHRAGHGIEHAFAVRVGDDDAVGIDRRRRIDRKILHIAIGQHHADGFGFLLRRGGGGIGVRDQRAVDDAALAGAGAGAAGKRLQQARRCRPGRRPKTVVADFDGPGALADRNARPASPRNARPACPARRQPAARAQQCAGAQAEQPQRRSAGRNGACGWSRNGGPGIGASLLSFRQKYPANNAGYRDSTPSDRMAAPRSAGKVRLCATHDVGGDCAVYMVRLSGWNPLSNSRYLPGWRSERNQPKNLDARPSPPIRPRFLEMDVILDPRAAREMRLGYGGDGRGFCKMSRRCELTAKGPQVGHKVSHSNIKTKRRFLPNLVQRHLHLGRARPQRAPARLDQRDQERRPQWRPRCVPAQGQGRRAVAPRAGSEARDREEGRQAGAGREGELSLLYLPRPALAGSGAG